LLALVERDGDGLAGRRMSPRTSPSAPADVAGRRSSAAEASKRGTRRRRRPVSIQPRSVASRLSGTRLPSARSNPHWAVCSPRRDRKRNRTTHEESRT